MKLNINKKNTALIIIDVINNCCAKECEIKKWNITFKKIRKMVPNLTNFIAKYREKVNNNIIFVNCTKWDKKHLPKNLIELYKDPKCCYYSKDKTGFSEKFYLLEPEKNDIIITKNTYDAFSNPKLDKVLKNKKIQYLIITGVFGEGCVDATIKNGFSKGYNFVILKDLIETTDQPHRQKFQRILKKQNWPIMYGPTINSKDLFKLIK